VVTLSAYEGLLAYKPDTSEIVPHLAKAYEMSPDALTYTFHLRDDVKFHDGTPMDAAAIKSSWERRTAVNQGPAYMLSAVASMETPDASTFVVHLKNPVDPFLDYLACPWSPKAVSPTAVAANAADGDLAQAWLTTHDAGTGPFTIEEFEPSSHYTLKAFPDYWNTKSSFDTVRIDIIPDVSTQRLELENGELDVVTKGLPIADIEFFDKNDKFTVTRRPIATKTAIYFNATSGIFADRDLRRAVRLAVDRKALIEPTYKDTATLSTEFFPSGFLAEGVCPDNPNQDTGPLLALMDGLPSKKLDIAYDEQGGATDRRLTELLQAQLQELGFDATVRGIPTSQAFAMWETPQDRRPDLMVNVAGGDALNPDTQLRIFYRTGAAPLNWFNYSDPEIDAAMDSATAQSDPAAAEKLYAEAGTLVVEEAWIINLGDLQDVIITPSSISNVVHDLASGRSIRLNELTQT
jgi:peptide/nickel transport system substrate-binding protein